MHNEDLANMGTHEECLTTELSEEIQIHALKEEIDRLLTNVCNSVLEQIRRSDYIIKSHLFENEEERETPADDIIDEHLKMQFDAMMHRCVI